MSYRMSREITETGTTQEKTLTREEKGLRDVSESLSRIPSGEGPRKEFGVRHNYGIDKQMKGDLRNDVT